MEPEFEQAPTYSIPNRRFLCVEYPGAVKNIDRVLETLGGEKSIAQAYGSKEDNVVELRYRPKDPFCHPINGSIVPTSQVLVKVTRRRKKNQPEDQGQLSTEIVGTIPQTCRFRGMADFQFVVPQSDPLRKLRSALLDGDAKQIQRFRFRGDDNNNGDLQGIPPPVFSNMEEPFKYDYKQNAPVVRVRVLQSDGTANRKKKIKLQLKKKWQSFMKNVLSGQDLLSVAYWTLKKDAISPGTLMISKHHISPRLTVFTIFGSISVLPYFAYSFQNGPWRECWVKYGVDPRLDQCYAIYQQLDIRMNQSQPGTSSYVRAKRPNPLSTLSASYNMSSNSSHSQTSKNETTRHVFDGQIVPSHSAWYQVCDIIDPDFACIFHSTDYMHAGPPTLQQLADTGRCDSMPNLDEGLVRQVEKDKEDMAEARSRTNERQKGYGDGSGFVADDDDDDDDDADYVAGDDDDDDDDNDDDDGNDNDEVYESNIADKTIKTEWHDRYSLP
ncbi:hypothetical protein [Absidia glauca]|uniref:Transcription factor IIIC subunit Tfc1/Sfc1 triple barrel domain-containing protein n=1 Tax=Absidia glauca TaxID=4829 RepID=A0A168SZZ9_ABSGL|nr:hypothetical protein [Absidia glauca]